MISTGIEAHGRAIAKAAGCFFNPECDHVISRSEGGILLGGVIFTGFTGASIGLHVAGFDPRWINKDMLWITFHYPFEQLGVRKITGTIPSGNRNALLFNAKLGFVEEARVADVFPDEDLIIMSMRREDCRWLKRGSRGK
jgi:RimJ/RimL family protein N-acetyltransferase